MCSLDNTNLLNQQSKSKDTFDFLKEKFPSGVFSSDLDLPVSLNKKALIVDASSLLHINPCTGSSVFEYSDYLFETHILPLFVDYYCIDLVFNSSESQQLKSFIHRKRSTAYGNIRT